jgi:transposase InsO family protein
VRQASQPLALIHSDICGPMATSSIGGAKYFLTFIDDFSHFLWVYTIKSKDEVFGKFLRNSNLLWKIKATRRSSVSRTDGGGEYISNAFQSFLISQGISWQRTIPYTPQQNGVAEWKE